MKELKLSSVSRSWFWKSCQNIKLGNRLNRFSKSEPPFYSMQLAVLCALHSVSKKNQNQYFTNIVIA